ncbi:helix-turn-helix domain-containing protein [Nisaea acidiphila]|uniref:Helix-turn-helix domain-containing protein n=1 Tax=Nisaea acidiphila TaxID=1862145 RepID=A0A9J7AYT1_9PROT|nr:helix-turn-helix transcriptional regulator [Nisaea acidiphila]UUX51946.1 helix-turn-helix domain-containing protein [Nisaea acidiphila]
MAEKVAFADLREELLQDPETRSKYETLELEFEVARKIIAARTKAGLTQQALAERMNTSRSTIARLEGGKTLPSLETVRRVARATGTEIRLSIHA